MVLRIKLSVSFAADFAYCLIPAGFLTTGIENGKTYCEAQTWSLFASSWLEIVFLQKSQT